MEVIENRITTLKAAQSRLNPEIGRLKANIQKLREIAHDPKKASWLSNQWYYWSQLYTPNFLDVVKKESALETAERRLAVLQKGSKSVASSLEINKLVRKQLKKDYDERQYFKHEDLREAINLLNQHNRLNIDDLDIIHARVAKLESGPKKDNEPQDAIASFLEEKLSQVPNGKEAESPTQQNGEQEGARPPSPKVEDVKEVESPAQQNTKQGGTKPPPPKVEDVKE